MLDQTEQLQLIRQVEKSNLTDEQSALLMKWAEEMMSQREHAEHVIVACDILEMIFEGDIDIVDFIDGEPVCNLTFVNTPHNITPKAVAEYDDDNDDEDEDDFDEKEDEEEIFP
ncbi:hypothetical protein LCGC14_0977410 [marine sediment metagenome]|uniref:Uncharacterized protein n=1 Tax=marine sediment metagenome TaxID=412755 RepID=A0A0F9N9V5_9ZZZZ